MIDENNTAGGEMCSLVLKLKKSLRCAVFLMFKGSFKTTESKDELIC